MNTRFDLEPCKHQGCTKKVFNKSGLCAEHRKRVCLHPGCLKEWTAVTHDRLCKQHRTIQQYRSNSQGMLNGQTL